MKHAYLPTSLISQRQSGCDSIIADPSKDVDARKQSSQRLTRQRQDAVDGYSIDGADADGCIKPARLSLNLDDEFEDEGYMIEDTVNPDDSATFRGIITKPRHKGSVCQREQAELRRLIQSDDRFGRALERTCQAVYECISGCNPSPVLALLASLVWNSLCIVWELEQKNPLPKAHLRSKIEGLKGEHQHVVESFDSARHDYLKEIVRLRDQIRRLDKDMLVNISNAVYEEEPVMFYEPLQYLHEKEREHVAEIVEEKVKLVLSKMDPEFIELLKKEKPPVKNEDDEEEEEMKESSKYKGLYEKSKRRVAELERDLRKSQEKSPRPSAGVRTSICKLMTLASQEWQDLSVLLNEEDDSSQHEVSKVLTEVSSQPASEHFSGESPSKLVGERLRSWTADSSKTSAVDRLDRPDHSRLSALSQRQPAETMEDVQEQIEMITGLLQAERQARSVLQAQFEQFRRSALEKAVEEPEPPKVDNTAQLEENVREAQLQESKVRQNLVEKERALKRAEERAQSLELELARLQSLLAERDASTKSDDALRLEMQRQLMKSEKLRRENESELEKALQTIEELREEIRRLRKIMSEPRLVEEEKTANAAAWSEALHWRTPTGKVFERLFQDSVDREDRRRTLFTSLQQARNEQALEIFQGHLRQMSSYDLPIDANGFTESELCPEVLQSHLSSWVMDRSKKSFADQPLVENDRNTAEALRDDISANVNAQLARKGSPTRVTLQRTSRSNSPVGAANQGPSLPSERSARSRSRVDKRGCSEAKMMLEGTHVDVIGEHDTTAEHDIADEADGHEENDVQKLDHKGEKVKFKEFAASLGLVCSAEPSVQSTTEACRQLTRKPPASSRPNSAQILRRAKQTITARPRSAAIQGFSRMQRPHSDVALAREAQRLLGQTNAPDATVHTVKQPETLSSVLGRSSSAPGLRSVRNRPGR